MNNNLTANIQSPHVIYAELEKQGAPGGVDQGYVDRKDKETLEAAKKYADDEIAQLSEEKLTIPATGSVGQVLAVQSVDAQGKPNAWGCVDQSGGGGGGGESDVPFGPMGGDWDLLYEDTTDAPTQFISYINKAEVQAHDRFFIQFTGTIEKSGCSGTISMNGAIDGWFIPVRYGNNFTNQSFAAYIYEGTQRTYNNPTFGHNTCGVCMFVNELQNNNNYHSITVSRNPYYTRDRVVMGYSVNINAGAKVTIYGRRKKA